MERTPSPTLVEAFRRSPMRFREYLTVDGAQGDLAYLKDIMAPFQRKDFEARDPCLLWVTGAVRVVDGKKVPWPRPDIRRFYYQRGRGSSKTTDIAIDMIWVVAFSTKKIDAVVVAEDKEQSQLLLVQAAKILAMNPWLNNFVHIHSNKMVNSGTGSEIHSVARDSGSSYGITADIIICDEWTHWTKKAMWSSIFSTFGKKSKMLVVSCNAGEGQDWKWRARELFRKSPQWYFSAPDGYAPWYTEADMAEQQAVLEPQEFARLWMNRWQVKGDQFLQLHTINACIDPSLQRQDAPEDGLMTYLVSFDYGEVKDPAVGTVAHWDGDTDTVIIDRMDVFDPACQPTGDVQIKNVLAWLLEVYHTYSEGGRAVFFVVDKYQLLSCVQTLREIIDDPDERLVEFEFASGNGNFEMAKLLQQRITNRQVLWYPGCGETYDQDGQVYRPQGSAIHNDLATELSELIKVKRGVGKWRFDHPSWGHDDRSFTVGAILWFIARALRNAEGETVESETHN